MSVFPDCHLGQRIGRTTKNQNARIAATPKSVTGTQYHLVRLLGVRVQNQIRNPIVARDRTAATITDNIWKSPLIIEFWLMVVIQGFEPWTFRLWAGGSDQLSYFRIWYSPEESNFMCRLIRPILNTVEDELHIITARIILISPLSNYWCTR